VKLLPMRSLYTCSAGSSSPSSSGSSMCVRRTVRQPAILAQAALGVAAMSSRTHTAGQPSSLRLSDSLSICCSVVLCQGASLYDDDLCLPGLHMVEWHTL
jgi:hypothetical protein